MPFSLSLCLSQAYRPLFPLAALLSATAMMLWLCGLSGFLPMSPHPTLWHAHEMLFGFASAVIMGFVLTAVVNWTGLAASSPRSLAWLCALWLGARLCAFWPTPGAHLLSAALDVLVLPLAAVQMSRVLLASGNRRNQVFIPLLWAMAIINLGIHLSLQLDRPDQARLLISFSAWLIGFLMVFMGGRVIPFFSGRRLSYQPGQWPLLNWLSTLSALATAITSLIEVSWLSASCAALAAVSTLLRLLLWQPWRSLGEPMLWILHLGYLWLAIAFALRAGLDSGLIHLPASIALHALLAGGLGCLALGMMSRVALGHSGRPIVASPLMLLSFVLIVLAGILRLGSSGPGSPVQGLPGLSLSALCWSLGFAIYFCVFAPLLWRPARETN